MSDLSERNAQLRDALEIMVRAETKAQKKVARQRAVMLINELKSDPDNHSFTTREKP